MDLFKFINTIMAIATFFIYLNMPAYAEEYFISPDGNDNSSGNLSSPFRTLEKTANIVKAGDTVYIRGGVYEERLNVTSSGQLGAYITFRNFENETVVIDATGLLNGIMLYGVSFIKIEGLTVKNSTRAGVHIHHHMDVIDGGSDFNIIGNNIVENCGSDGLSGIFIGGHNNQVIGNSIIYNGRIEEDNPTDHGVYLLGNNNDISNNFIAYNARSGIRMEGENNSIDSNLITSNGESGISVWVDYSLKARNITISRNVIADHPQDSIRVNGAGEGERPIDIKVYNNTIVNHNTARYGIRFINGVRQIQSINNIITGNYSKGLFQIHSESIEGDTEDYNIYFGTGSFYYNGIRYDDFLSYKLGSSMGTHSTFENPDLRTDYSLSEDSIALEGGIDVSIPFNGDRPNIGALGGDGDGTGIDLPPPFFRPAPVIRFISMRK